MSQNVAQTLNSASDYVTDDWENGEEVEKQVQERLKQVRILQREKADKEALIAKVRAEDSHKAEMAAATGLSSSNDAPSSSSSTANPLPMKMQILRRPKPYSDQSIDCQGREAKPVEHTDETAAQHEMNEEVRKARTLEARQAAYDEARLRILGTDYKPDETPTPQITVVDRSKSPEQIRIPNYSKNGHSMNKQQPQPHLVGTNPNPNVWSRSASSPNTFMQTGAMPPHYALPNVANHASAYNISGLGGGFQSGVPLPVPVSAIDTSRPPPPLPPSFYVGPLPNSAAVPQRCPPIVTASTNVPYGRPPLAIYPTPPPPLPTPVSAASVPAKPPQSTTSQGGNPQSNQQQTASAKKRNKKKQKSQQNENSHPQQSPNQTQPSQR